MTPPPPQPRPTTVAAYLDSAPSIAQPHLRALDALLREAAPHAQAVIKWNTPFFIEPRFLFAYSFHKAHLGFVATPETLQPFAAELEPYEVTMRGIVKIKYRDELPAALLRRIAQQRIQELAARDDDAFW